MSTRELISMSFDLFIRKQFASKEQIRELILNHERKQACIDNICQQVLLAEFSPKGKKLNRMSVIKIAEGAAEMFSYVVLEYEKLKRYPNESKLCKRPAIQLTPQGTIIG